MTGALWGRSLDMAGSEFDKAKMPRYRRTLYMFVAFIALIVLGIANSIVNPPPPETPALNLLPLSAA
jgi:hypothetical protein